MKFFHLTFLVCLFLLFQSCSEKDKACNGICSEEYRTIVVNIENNQGDPVLLDSFKVVDLGNGSDITLQLDDWTRDYQRERGIYPIFSDKYVREYRQLQAQIKFTGFIDGQEVVSEIYKVAVDCCHVVHLAGDLELVI